MLRVEQLQKTMIEEINIALRLKPEIDFSKLPEEDVKRIHAIITDGQLLIAIGVKRIKESGQEWLERPIKEIMDSPLGDFLADLPEKEPEKGPLGLGILPKLLGTKTTAKKPS